MQIQIVHQAGDHTAERLLVHVIQPVLHDDLVWEYCCRCFQLMKEAMRTT